MVTGNGKVGLVHAVVPAMDAVNQYFDLAGLAAVNLLDESLLPMAERRGGVDEVATERLASLVQLAIDADVVAVVVTCNAYSGAAARVAERYADVPVLSIDRVLVETAVGQARRIGLVGTVAVGLRQQERLVSDVARQRGKKVEIRSRLREDAVEALRAGDRARHDAIIAEEAESLKGVDIIVLGQASMAAAVEVIAARGRVSVPVLASPQLMVQHLLDRKIGTVGRGVSAP